MCPRDTYIAPKWSNLSGDPPGDLVLSQTLFFPHQHCPHTLWETPRSLPSGHHCLRGVTGLPKELLDTLKPTSCGKSFSSSCLVSVGLSLSRLCGCLEALEPHEDRIFCCVASISQALSTFPGAAFFHRRATRLCPSSSFQRSSAVF